MTYGRVKKRHMRSKKRIILIRGTWETLDVFSKGLESYFAETGAEVFVLDTKELLISLGKLYDFIQKPVDAVITFNNVGLNIELTPREKLWNQLDFLCINILVDHPVCYLQELQMAPKKTVAICVDKNHVHFIKRYFSNIMATHFVPHGGMLWKKEQISWQERDIDVLYAGGLPRDVAAGYIPQNLNEICGINSEELCDKVLTALITNTKCTLETAIENYFRKQQIEVADEQLLQYIRLFRFLDVYAISYYRERAIKLLIENGIHVTLYGPGWEKCEWISHPNLEYHPNVPPEEILTLMGRAKIVLNSMPNFKNGSHERIFNGMLAGAVVVSDTSRYLEEEAEGKNFLYLYELKKQHELPEMITHILEHPQDAKQMTERAYKVAVEHHTWQKRAQKIEEYIERYQSGNTI